MNFRRFIFHGLALLFSTAALHAEVTIDQIAADPKLWPPEVQLTHAVPLQLFENGKAKGEMQGAVGMALKVRKVEATRLTVGIGTALAVVPPTATDILKRLTPAQTGMAAAALVGNFRTGWTMKRGKWTPVSDTEITQMDPKDTVSNAYTTVSQSGRMEYRLKQRFFGGKSACTTIYFMSDAGDKPLRGNAYLVADALNEKGAAEVTINKVLNDGPRKVATFPADPMNGQWIDLLITYDAGTGVIDVTRNGKPLGSWKDPDPIKTGKDFSIGTCLTKAAFKDVAVRSLP